MKQFVVTLALACSLSMSGQSKKQDPPKTPPPAAAAQPDASKAESITPEVVKGMRDGLQQLQVDQMAVQTARDKFIQNDGITKQAMQLVQERSNSDPDVQKTTEKMEADRKAIIAKIDALRKAQHLDSTYDWDFQQGKFVKSNTAPAPPTPPAKG
jgi:tRNA(Glu) U13 pseudouridine synthase TruD